MPGPSITVLGLDPGSERTGYALARFEGDRVVELTLGTWHVPGGLSPEDGLAHLVTHCEGFLDAHAVSVAAVESLFHHRNVRSLIVLAQARGALLAALGRRGIAVHAYPPATVKRTVCGSGAAAKEQVRKVMLLTVPGLSRFPVEAEGLDATDALAIAVTHRVHARSARVLGLAGRR